MITLWQTIDDYHNEVSEQLVAFIFGTRSGKEYAGKPSMMKSP